MNKEVVKTSEKFSPKGMRYRRKQLRNVWYLINGNVRFAFWFLKQTKSDSCTIYNSHPVGKDFIGINVSTTADPEKGDYILDRLKELGISSIRIDFGYGSFEKGHHNFIERLIECGYDVMLHLVQPAVDAASMHDNDAQRRWADFVKRTFEQFKNKVVYVEIGSTPNRNSWSGYITAW